MGAVVLPQGVTRALLGGFCTEAMVMVVMVTAQRRRRLGLGLGHVGQCAFPSAEPSMACRTALSHQRRCERPAHGVAFLAERPELSDLGEGGDDVFDGIALHC